MPQKRSIRFRRMRWSDGLLIREGRGQIEVTTREIDSGNEAHATLSVDFRVESLENGIKITEMYYE